MIRYEMNGTILSSELDSFFQNWQASPPVQITGKVLAGSDLIVTARDDGKLTGFLTAISDGTMHAFISLVEVLEPYQEKGIGKRLMELAISHFKGYYDIVLITDADKQQFYKKLGFEEIYGMHIRDFTYGEAST